MGGEDECQRVRSGVGLSSYRGMSQMGIESASLGILVQSASSGSLDTRAGPLQWGRSRHLGGLPLTLILVTSDGFLYGAPHAEAIDIKQQISLERCTTSDMP